MRNRPAADILDRGENAFIGRRCVEARCELVGAHAGNGIAQCLERRQRQHQRRLADGLRPIDGFFAIRLSKKIDVKVRGHIVRGRNLVGGWRVGLQFALVVPPQLLHRKPAVALDEPALDLSAVERRVERGPHVMQDVHGKQPVLAGQRVDRHFGDSRAVREIEEGAPGQRLAVVVNLGRRVEAGRGQLHARHVRHPREFREWQ